jgi:hypothetical protein
MPSARLSKRNHMLLCWYSSVFCQDRRMGQPYGCYVWPVRLFEIKSIYRQSYYSSVDVSLSHACTSKNQNAQDVEKGQGDWDWDWE